MAQRVASNPQVISQFGVTVPAVTPVAPAVVTPAVIPAATLAVSPVRTGALTVGPGPLSLAATWLGNRLIVLGRTHVWTWTHHTLTPVAPALPTVGASAVLPMAAVAPAQVQYQLMAVPIQPAPAAQVVVVPQAAAAPVVRDEAAPPPPAVPTASPQSTAKHAFFGWGR
jgi:hypothetical protein